MYEKTRNAVDVAGNKVVLTEKQGSDYTVRGDGSIKFTVPPRLFGPDGSQLIPEGKGFYRTPFGVRYQLTD